LKQEALKTVGEHPDVLEADGFGAPLQIVGEPENLIERGTVLGIGFQHQKALLGIRKKLTCFFQKPDLELFFEIIHGATSRGRIGKKAGKL
jgi:hypothetical protein